MNIKLITVCSHPEHAQNLVRSATKQGWDLQVCKVDWKGFGTKLIVTYEYLKEHPEITHFVFADAYDVVCLGTMEEFLSKVEDDTFLISAEKGLWPPILQPFRCKYANTKAGFNHINSGLYFSEVSEFFDLYEKYTPFYEIDDQYWLNMAYLMEEASPIQIDYAQTVFSSYSFIAEGEYTYENNRVQILGNEPIFIHGNGRSDMSKVIELI